MSAEQELILRLNQSNTTTLDNLKFGIKAIKSAEFVLSSKFEIVVNWFSSNCNEIFAQSQKEEAEFETIDNFLKLKCPISLISHTASATFIAKILDVSLDLRNKINSKKFIEILLCIAKHEIFQNVDKERYQKFSQLYKNILMHYEDYVRNNYAEKFPIIHEKIFFDQIIQNIKEYIKRVPEPNLQELADAFKANCLTNLVEIILTLKGKNLNYFNDLLEIEHLLFSNYIKNVFNFDNELPIHVHLLNFECSLINNRGNIVFYQFFIENGLAFAESFAEPKQYLLVLIYLFELLRKYGLNLKFEIESESAVKYIANKIQPVIKNNIENNVYEIMWLLKSIMKLNPLIVEHSVFDFAAKIIVTSTLTEKNMDIFKNFITALLEMFKKINRPEKCTINLIKALNELLKEGTLSKKGKRKSLNIQENSAKKFKNDYHNSSDIDAAVSSQNTTNRYFEIMLNDFQDTQQSGKTLDKGKELKYYENNNFTVSLGIIDEEFSKFVSTIMSKPSIVIWKSIAYDLKKLIETLQQERDIKELDETFIFKIELYSLLLSQYFCGSKLAEHYDKFSDEIKKNIESTKILMKAFGQFVLNIEHCNRIVNAFLQIVQNFGMFCSILSYYSNKEESNESPTSSKNIYESLSPDEWILIEQRIANFGDFNSKFNINRLSLQKFNAKLLIQKNSSKVNFKNILPASTFTDSELILKIFLDRSNLWLIKHLWQAEKHHISSIVLEKVFAKELGSHYLQLLMEDYECLKIIIVEIYRHFGKLIATKKSVLHTIDFETYKALQLEDKLKLVIGRIESTSSKKITVIEREVLEDKLQIFDLFNIVSCQEDLKMEIFVLHLALYRDLLQIEGGSLRKRTYNILEDLLYFKPSIKISNYITISLFTKILEPSASKKFYEILIQSIKLGDEEYVQHFLNDALGFLQHDEIMSGEQIKLNLILIETLPKINNKKLTPVRNELLQKFEKYFLNFIQKEKITKIDERIFVKETLPAFSIYLSYALNKANNNEFEITEQFRKFCKIYIAYSVEFLNSYSILLMKTSLTHRQKLHFDADEIHLILQKYWEEIKKNIQVEKSLNLEDKSQDNCYKSVVELLVSEFSNAEFSNFLFDLGIVCEDNVVFICRLIQLISGLQLSNLKCAILNDYFKKLSLQILFTLEKDSNQQYVQSEVVVTLLNTMRLLCENRTIPLSLDHIDSIISFLIDIDIKKFVLTDDNEITFKNMNTEMTNLCIALIKSRHEVISDRIPHLIIIYQDLLQSICWYKCERQKDVALNEEDLQDLAELAAKLENMMHLLAKDELNLKRVAPYLLTYIISLMVTEKRSTTLYSKIKTHIDSICYVLIKVCDHRVGPFILRCTNDATRQVYENMLKEFKKYHKFKGKV